MAAVAVHSVLSAGIGGSFRIGIGCAVAGTGVASTGIVILTVVIISAVTGARINGSIIIISQSPLIVTIIYLEIFAIFQAVPRAVLPAAVVYCIRVLQPVSIDGIGYPVQLHVSTINIGVLRSGIVISGDHVVLVVVAGHGRSEEHTSELQSRI